jgi:protein-S-isoprenylcysteine O-methyltransferase Ste14
MPRRHWFSKPYADVVARLRVPAGFLLLVAFGWLARPTVNTLLTGLPISICGLALRAGAAGHLAKNQRLAQSGPYAATRNPLYLGTLITAMGLAVAGDSVWLALLFAVIFLLVYLPAIELEEQHLMAILPGYPEFAARVPLLVPKWPKSWGPDSFSAALYRKNEEYKALIGWLAGVMWLLLRFRTQR